MVKQIVCYIFIFMGFIAFTASARQHKAVIDTTEINHWIGLGSNADLRICGNGKYFSYSIKEGAFDFNRIGIIVQSTENNWKWEFKDGQPGCFSSDSKIYVLQVKDDLCFIELGSTAQQCERGITNFKQQQKINPTWVAWQLKDSSSTLVICNLTTGRKKAFQHSVEYGFDKSGNWVYCYLKNKRQQLVLYNLVNGKELYFDNVDQCLIADNGRRMILYSKHQFTGKQNLDWIDIGDGKRKSFWQSQDESESIISFSFDKLSSQVVFNINKKAEEQNHISIGYYNPNLEKGIIKVNERMEGVEGLLVKEGVFNDDGQLIMFNMEEHPEYRKPSVENVKLDVWSYRDTIIQSRQLLDNLLHTKRYAAAFSLETDRIVRLSKYDELLSSVGTSYGAIYKNDYFSDRFWEPGYNNDSGSLIRLKDGSRVALPRYGKQFNFWVSPHNEYVIYSDDTACNYFSYNLKTGKCINITTAIPEGLLCSKDEYNSEDLHKLPVGLAGWSEDDKAVLIYDNHDIWQLDVEGKHPAFNMTNGYGRKNGVIFRLAFTYKIKVQGREKSWLLSAYDTKDHYNGFYLCSSKKDIDPELLFMGPFCIDQKGPSTMLGSLDIDHGMTPVEAANGSSWIIKRQSAQEQPNYYWTKDFTKFKALTDFKAHKNYNWLSAELVRFSQTDGKKSQGVLYKPENFDSTKKYPVIIMYYRYLSHRLYQYPFPDFMRSADVNIPWFVSRGYLVFTPDIYGTHDRDEIASLNAVEGAAKHLNFLPFVDGKRMGICGHSIGGAKTMYIVTHSNMFAAALAGAAPRVDWISNALGIENKQKGQSSLKHVENIRGGSIWESPDLWVKDNPVMRADKVTSPLLIYHGERDAIPVSQPLEMFLALRRLNKPVWLLNYNESAHSVSEKDSKDFTLRVTQFFNHYLKDEPAPRWMIEGIPAQLKQIESRLELDVSGRNP